MTLFKIKGLLVFFVLVCFVGAQKNSNRTVSSLPIRTISTTTSIQPTTAIAKTKTTTTATSKSNKPISSSSSNTNFNNLIGCPPPLIAPPPGINAFEYNNCINGCCIPCPALNVFYRTNQIDTIYSVISVFRVLSFICVMFLVVSYLVLPNKRDHPDLTIFNLSIFVALFMSVTFFYIGDHKRVQCVNAIESSTMTNNPFYCGFQGILLIFSTFGAVLWAFLLILHLHLHTVWGSKLISQNYYGISAIIFIATTIFTLIPAATHNIGFDFGAVCLVSLQNSNDMFWGPLSVFVFPGFLIHCWTCIHAAKEQATMNREATSTYSRRLSGASTVGGVEVVKAFKDQWRALLLALVFLVTVVIYWAFFVTQGSLIVTSSTPQWLTDWFKCVYNQGGQDKCSALAKPHIPNITFFVTAETATAFTGINIFIIFGMRRNLYVEWSVFFSKLFGPRQRLRNLPAPKNIV